MLLAYLAAAWSECWLHEVWALNIVDGRCAPLLFIKWRGFCFHANSTVVQHNSLCLQDLISIHWHNNARQRYPPWDSLNAQRASCRKRAKGVLPYETKGLKTEARRVEVGFEEGAIALSPQTIGFGEYCKLPQWGPGWSHCCSMILLYFEDFLGSIFCYFIKGKDLQKSPSLAERGGGGCANPP